MSDTEPKKTEFRYKIYHNDKERVLKDKLNECDIIEDFKIVTTISSNSNNELEKKSNVYITIIEDGSFEELDSYLENTFEKIWFEY